MEGIVSDREVMIDLIVDINDLIRPLCGIDHLRSWTVAGTTRVIERGIGTRSRYFRVFGVSLKIFKPSSSYEELSAFRRLRFRRGRRWRVRGQRRDAATYAGKGDLRGRRCWDEGY